MPAHEDIKSQKWCSTVTYLTLFNRIFAETSFVGVWHIYYYSMEWCSIRPAWEGSARPVLFIASSITISWMLQKLSNASLLPYFFLIGMG